MLNFGESVLVVRFRANWLQISLMLHLRHVDSDIVLVRADPFDPDDALLEIYRHDQPVRVAFDVEDDALGGHDAGGGIGTPHVRRACSACFLRFVGPGV